MFFPISDRLTGHLITRCAFYLTGYIMIHCEVNAQFKACHLTGHPCPTVHFILTGIPSPIRHTITNQKCHPTGHVISFQILNNLLEYPSLRFHSTTHLSYLFSNYNSRLISSTTYLLSLTPIPLNNPPVLPLQLQQSSHIFNNLPIVPLSNSTQQPTRSSSPLQQSSHILIYGLV